MSSRTWGHDKKSSYNGSWTKRLLASPYFFAWLRGVISLESQSSFHRPAQAPSKNGMTLPVIENHKDGGLNFGLKGASSKTLESERRSSFRASEARPGIQDFQAILDSGFRRNDEGDDFDLLEALKADGRFSVTSGQIVSLPAIENPADVFFQRMARRRGGKKGH